MRGLEIHTVATGVVHASVRLCRQNASKWRVAACGYIPRCVDVLDDSGGNDEQLGPGIVQAPRIICIVLVEHQSLIGVPDATYKRTRQHHATVWAIWNLDRATDDGTT